MTGQLRFKPRRKLAVLRLPYVGTEHCKPECGASMWDVPLTGGYAGGCVTGTALAPLAVKIISEEKGTSWHLKSIVLAWVERGRAATPQEMRVLRGQIVGFMEMIGPLVHDAGLLQTQALQNLDTRKLLKEANHGLRMIEPE